MAEPVPLEQYGNIKPVCLPAQGADFTETTATVTGWGWGFTQSFNFNYNSWLHEVQVSVVADEVCIITFDKSFNVGLAWYRDVGQDL